MEKKVMLCFPQGDTVGMRVRDSDGLVTEIVSGKWSGALPDHSDDLQIFFAVPVEQFQAFSEFLDRNYHCDQETHEVNKLH